MNHTKFAIRRFENRNGVTSWRVDGSLHGVRFRRNFKTREEAAAAEQAILEIKALNEANGLHTIATVLTADQVREAEAVFHRFGRQWPSALILRRFRIGELPGARTEKAAGRRHREYVAAKEHEFELDHIRARSWDGSAATLGSFRGASRPVRCRTNCS